MQDCKARGLLKRLRPCATFQQTHCPEAADKGSDAQKENDRDEHGRVNDSSDTEPCCDNYIGKKPIVCL